MASGRGGTHLVVDGSNIATEGRTMPSLAQLDEAVRALLEHEPHDAWTVVVDATFEHRIDPAESQMYEEALAAGELLTPPAGTIGRGDKFLLEIASRVEATVFSNDSFQEFHAEYPWLFEGGRLIGGKPVPGVGWIFAERSPVRGAKSRMVTREAAKRSRRTAAKPSVEASGPPPVPTTPPPGPPPRKRAARTTKKQQAEAAVAEAVAEVVADASASNGQAESERRRRRRGRGGDEAVNDGLAFVEFIADHPVGARVSGTVDSFSSHGAWITVGSVRCYAPLRALADPAPRSARDVLSRGETREFVVDALDAPRRGIDLALPGFERPEAASGPTTVGVGAVGTPTAPPTDQASADAEATLPESEATLATTTTTRTKKAAKKTTAAAKKKGTAVKRKATTKSTAAAKKTKATGAAAKRKATSKATTKKAPATKRATGTTSKRTAATKKKKAASPAKKTASAAKKTVKKARATGQKTVKKATKAVKRATKR